MLQPSPSAGWGHPVVWHDPRVTWSDGGVISKEAYICVLDNSITNVIDEDDEHQGSEKASLWDSWPPSH